MARRRELSPETRVYHVHDVQKAAHAALLPPDVRHHLGPAAAWGIGAARSFAWGSRDLHALRRPRPAWTTRGGDGPHLSPGWLVRGPRALRAAPALPGARWLVPGRAR